jgi:DNA mismatch repair protein MutS2
VETARSELDPTDLRAEDLLDEIYRQRDLSRQARHAAEEARREAQHLRGELATRLDAIEDERQEILEGARAEAQSEIEALREEFRALRRELKRARQPLDVIEPVQERVEQLEEKVEKPVERRASDVTRVEGPIRLGSKVRLHSLGTQGVVTALSEDEAEVQVGRLRVRTRLAELELMADAAEDESPDSVDSARETRVTVPKAESPGVELDLRGQMADEAIDSLEGYLDRAYLAGLPWVRIIHGKGTGRLRQVVRRALGKHPHVRSFEPGGHGEGGDGVTVAKLRE